MTPKSLDYDTILTEYEDIFEEEKCLCLYFPERTVNTSPRSKIAIFNTTEELLEEFPTLRTILTPLTVTNHCLYIIDQTISDWCNIFVIYGDNIEYKTISMQTGLMIYEKYLHGVKTYPFATILDVDLISQTINGLKPSIFLERVKAMLSLDL